MSKCELISLAHVDACQPRSGLRSTSIDAAVSPVDHRCSSRHSGITRGILRAGSRSPLQCHCARETVGRVFFLGFPPLFEFFFGRASRRNAFIVCFPSPHFLCPDRRLTPPPPQVEGRDPNDDDRGQHQRRLTATKRKCSAAVCSALTKAQS